MADELFILRNGRTVLDEELSEKLFQIKQFHPESASADSTGFEWNDFGMANLFSEVYSQEARYCAEHKSWYTYSDGAWRKDEGGILAGEKLKDFVRLMLLYCGEISDDELRKNYTTFVNKMGDQRMRGRILKDAQGEMRIAARDFDADPYLINCKNGTYNLRDCTFYPHQWKDFLTMQTDFSHTVSREIRYPRWEQFISEACSGDEEKADYLQRALGYSIVGKSNEACMFILWGKTTRNGKSTLLGTIERMMGDYSRSAPVGLICKDKNAKDVEAASPMLAALKGKRFVTMSESDEYGRLDEEKIKQYTGGEEITARALYQSAVTWLPQFTLWLSCNDLPAVRDKSLFASERVRVIEFSRHFSQTEQDKSLSELFDSQEARSGIFMWLIRGYLKYKERGLVMNDRMRKVVATYEHDNDVVLQFLEDCCQHIPGNSVKPKDLYARYRQWAKSEGRYLMGTIKFYSEVERHPEWTSGREHGRMGDVFADIAFKTVLGG